MIERVENPERRAEIARAILEALKDWFEVDETRENYIEQSRNGLFLLKEIRWGWPLTLARPR